MDKTALIHQSIMQDMTEGVMTVGFDGRIQYVNPAAADILGVSAGELMGRSFARCFFGYAENDAFNQTILDAVYDSASIHRNIVPYYTGTQLRQLHVTTSYLHAGGTRVGVVAVLSDISELTELRDAVKAMKKIKSLNEQLELRNKLLSETFGRFLSDEIVRQLLDTPDGLALGGKKHNLTILMSDLRGFTAFSERMEPRALITMLNHYLGEMTQIIQSRGGTIIEFIGDAILAIFGAPAPTQTHAADAVAAAVDMEQRMEAVNAWNRERGFPELEMGIGINTGEVIVGNIGSEKRTKYGVVGSHVNLCGRIESYTVGGQILISPTTRALIQSPLEIPRELEVHPKGVQGALLLSQVTGIGAPYGVCVARDTGPAPMEPVCIPVEFRCIAEKHCSQDRYRGTIIAMGGRRALMVTQQRLGLMDNICVCAGAEWAAKVVSLEKEGCMLHFSAIPEDFQPILLRAAEQLQPYENTGKVIQ